MKISNMIGDSIVDGRGLRFTIFTQGCTHNCIGCHNPQTHDLSGGHETTTNNIIYFIKENPLLDGITFSGGEPFLQSHECAALAKEVHSLGLNVWTYTGYTYEEIISAQNEEWQELLLQTDVLVDGKFQPENRSMELKFRGSKNQKIIDVKKSIEKGSIIEYTV